MSTTSLEAAIMGAERLQECYKNRGNYHEAEFWNGYKTALLSVKKGTLLQVPFSVKRPEKRHV